MRVSSAVLGGLVLLAAVSQTAASREYDFPSRRDPFDIYVAPPPKPKGPRRKRDKPGKKETLLPTLDPEEILDEAHGIMRNVGGMLEERDYLGARDTTQVALDDMRKAGLEGRDEFDRMLRYHETAVRLHRRARVEEYLENKNIRLQGIVWDDTSPVVLIGNKMLHEGDAIEDVTIESIGRSEVILLKDGVRIRKSM